MRPTRRAESRLKDFRTANDLGAAPPAPTLILTTLGGLVLPGGVVRPLVIGLVYGVAAIAVLRHALKTVTFERRLA